MDIPMKLLVDLASGESKMVALDETELAQRDKDQADAAAREAAYVPPVDPVVAVVQTVLSAATFDEAKKNLAAFVADREKGV